MHKRKRYFVSSNDVEGPNVKPKRTAVTLVERYTRVAERQRVHLEWIPSVSTLGYDDW